MSDVPEWIQQLQKPPARLPDKAERPAPLLFDSQHQPITTPEQWTRRRSELDRAWRDYLGEIPAPGKPPTYQVIEEDRRDGVIRQLVRYEAEPGLPVEGYLLRPIAIPEGVKTPGAVVLHSTVDYTIRQPAGLEGPSEKFIGLHLARRGYTTFSPRCYLWQYSQGNKIATAVDWLRERHPRVKGMAKMLFDAVRAVDLLVSLPHVDTSRIASIGHSLGAKEVLYLAAFDTRVRATVSSEGGIGIGYSNWDAPWYLGDAVKRPGFNLDHAQILAMIAPRAFLLMGGDSADGDISWPYIEAALPVWALLGASDAVGLSNHRQGHAYPPSSEALAERWFSRFLDGRSSR